MVAKKKIGFIGVGKMGNPIARNLINNGYALKVYDVVPEARQVFADHGAEVVDSAMEAASGVELVISSILSMSARGAP